MAELPRLNGVIRALEQGKPTFTAFSPAEINSALAMSTSKYDGVVFEMEHNFWDGRALRDCFQYMLNRRQIVDSGSLAPGVTPMVRIPPNGAEKNQWLAKQALDLGAYGIVWPHISTVEEAYNAVAACRYPRLKSAPLYEPAGIRGGENVYPREIEEFLFRHPKIEAVQVIGVPDTKYGEELCAWVKLKPGMTATPAEIQEFCKGQIAHYKVPRYIKFVDAFPMTVTGKIQKFIMRERSIAELGLKAQKTA